VPHPSDSQSNPDREVEFDGSLVTHTLREAKWIVVIWAISFLWVIGYCSRYGATGEVGSMATVGGIPAWVFWGIALPWVIATIVTCWFALAYVVDEPLDGEALNGKSLNGKSLNGKSLNGKSLNGEDGTARGDDD
jgi:hypothetical protein